MALTMVSFNSVPVSAVEEVVVNSVYLNFNQDGFDKYHIGQAESVASDQFRTLVTVKAEDSEKYGFEAWNSGLVYYIPAYDGWGNVFTSDEPITGDRDYHLSYVVEPKAGYKFADNLEDMKFYINGDLATLKNSEYVGYNSWQVFVDIGNPAPRPPVVNIEKVNIKNVTEPEDGEEAKAPPVDSKMFSIYDWNWSSADDDQFATDNTFKEGKTYKIQITLEPKAGYAFKKNGDDPPGFDGTAKINKKNATAALDGAGRLVINYTFPKLPETVKDIYLTFDSENFTSFQVGKAENAVTPQFKTLVNVRAEDQEKYGFDQYNSGLIYQDIQNNSWVNTVDSTDNISSDKNYCLDYVIEPKPGYVFPSNQDAMNFYINGVKTVPKEAMYVGYDSWRIYVPAYVLEPQGAVNVKLYGYNDINASWNKQNVAGAEVKYKVEYKKSTENDYTVFPNYTNNTYYKKANLADGAAYKFKVTPYVESNGAKYEGKSSESSSIYTLKKINTPKVSKASKYYTRVKWTNIPGESGYQIARSAYKTKNFSTVKTPSYKYSSTTVKTKRNKTYYYKVRAYKTVDGKRIYAPWSSVRAYRLR